MLKRLLALAFSLLLTIGYSMAAEQVITGEVYYRERIALPPGATLHVGLVGLPGGEPVAGAGATIPTRGEVPLQFTFAVRSSVAQSDRSFGLIAEIRLGSAILFRNDAPVPVDLSAPSPVSILVTRQRVQRPVPVPDPEPLPAPEREPEPTPEEEPPAELLGTDWQVTSIGGVPVTGLRPLTLSIAHDLRASGHAGCNDYFSQASIEGDKVQFSLAAATRKACVPDGVMAQENAFLNALAAITGYEISHNSLRLLDAAGVPLIGLVRARN